MNDEEGHNKEEVGSWTSVSSAEPQLTVGNIACYQLLTAFVGFSVLEFLWQNILTYYK